MAVKITFAHALTARSRMLAEFVGVEVGWIAADSVASTLHGIRPSPEGAPLRGARRVHLYWRWVLWLAGMSASVAYFAGWLPRAGLISLDLMLIGALLAGRLSYLASARRTMRDSLSRRLSVGSPPERHVSLFRLIGVGLLAVITTMASNILGNSAAQRPLGWIFVIAFALAVLEPLTDLLFESHVERRTGT